MDIRNLPAIGALLIVSVVFLAAPAPADIQVEPTEYDFGDVEVATPSTTIITVSNVPGMVMEPLTIYGTYFDSGSSGDFEITVNPEGITIPVGESEDIEITFTPSDEGYESATLVVASSDLFHPLIYVALSGTGVESDSDGDGIDDNIDNCPATPNPAQSDIDSDGAGDICDICPNDALDLCDPNGSTADEIDAAVGGTIETPDGYLSIEIEPGDLADDATISVTRSDTQDPDVDIMIGFNPGWGEEVAVYNFEPDDLVFNSSVTVTVTVDVTAMNDNQRQRLSLYLWDEAEEHFVLLETTSTSIVEDPPGTWIKIFTVELDHFSIYAVVLPVWWDTLGDGDFTAEGTIDYHDLAIMSQHWHETGNSIANIAPLPIPDNTVNVLDLAILAKHWLEDNTP